MAYVEENLTKELSAHPSLNVGTGITYDIKRNSRASSEETTNNGKNCNITLFRQLINPIILALS